MTWEPLSNIIADDPYSYAICAKKFNILKHTRMETTQKACQNSKKTHLHTQEIQAKAS